MDSPLTSLQMAVSGLQTLVYAHAACKCEPMSAVEGPDRLTWLSCMVQSLSAHGVASAICSLSCCCQSHALKPGLLCRFVVHLTTPSLGQSPSDVLAPVISTLFSGSDSSTPPTATPSSNTTGHPHILFQAFWTQPGQVTESAPSISNIAICQPPSSVVGFGSALQGARGLYCRLYPGEDLFGLSSADAGLSDDSDAEAADALEAALAGLPDA